MQANDDTTFWFFVNDYIKVNAGCDRCLCGDYEQQNKVRNPSRVQRDGRNM